MSWTPGPRSIVVPTSVETRNRQCGNEVAWHLLSIKEIASACQLSEKAVRRAIDEGELPAVKLRSRLRVTPQDFEAWITAQRRQRARRPELSLGSPGARRAPAGTFRALVQPDTGREVSK